MGAASNEPTGVVERDGQVVFVPSPPSRVERWAWVALWIAGPIVFVSSLFDVYNGNSVILSLGTAAFVLAGGVTRVRANRRRKQNPHLLDPVALPADLLDEARTLHVTGQGPQAMDLIRKRTGLGFGDAVAVVTYARKRPRAAEADDADGADDDAAKAKADGDGDGVEADG